MLSITNTLMLMTALFNAGLSIFILRNNLRNATNVLLGAYLATLSAWAVALIFTQIGVSYGVWLYSARFTYTAGLIIAGSLYLFSICFPEDTRLDSKTLLMVLAPASLFIILLFASPDFLIRKIVHYDWGNAALLDTNEFLLFTALFCILYLVGLARLWAKGINSTGENRTRLFVIATGVTATGIGGLYFDIILASPYINDFRFLWTGPLFNTVLAVVIIYAVFYLRLFNAKVIVAEVAIGLLWIFTFLRTLLAADSQERFFNGLLFLLALVIGDLLIRSVKKEVAQREKIEAQEQELEVVNRQQENLLHFMSHEIKGYLAKSEAGFAAIAEGDYGPVSDDMKNMTTMALTDVRKGVRTVMDILEAANLKRGTVSYNKKEFDLKKSVAWVVETLRPAAEEKKLTFEYSEPSDSYPVNGDEDKIINHVIRNLIDNSIKYTLAGKVSVSLSREGKTARFVVEDTGVGITEEDKKRLFTQGGRGKDSIKVNVHSTGYGLYIAKQIVEAHGGKIWADSDGAGKGSRFVVELPLV